MESAFLCLELLGSFLLCPATQFCLIAKSLHLTRVLSVGSSSPMQDETMMSANTTLLDNESLDVSCNMRTVRHATHPVRAALFPAMSTVLAINEQSCEGSTLPCATYAWRGCLAASRQECITKMVRWLYILVMPWR